MSRAAERSAPIVPGASAQVAGRRWLGCAQARRSATKTLRPEVAEELGKPRVFRPGEPGRSEGPKGLSRAPSVTPTYLS